MPSEDEPATAEQCVYAAQIGTLISEEGMLPLLRKMGIGGYSFSPGYLLSLDRPKGKKPCSFERTTEGWKRVE